MQSTIYFLQQQLKEAKETIANLQQQQQQQQQQPQKAAPAAEPAKESAEEKMEEEVEEEEESQQPEERIQREPEQEPEPEVAVDEDRERPEERAQSPDEKAAAAAAPEAEPEVDVAAGKEEDDEEEEEEVSLRSSRRGRATPTKSPAQTKRGRATRGQKRDVSFCSRFLQSPSVKNSFLSVLSNATLAWAFWTADPDPWQIVFKTVGADKGLDGTNPETSHLIKKICSCFFLLVRIFKQPNSNPGRLGAKQERYRRPPNPQ